MLVVMGRPATSCIGLGVDVGERCPECSKAKPKKACWRKTNQWPPSLLQQESSVASAGGSSGNATGVGLNADPDADMPSASAAPATASEELAATERRQRKAPLPIYVPDEVGVNRLPLPDVPMRKAVQSARTEELAALRAAELEAAHAAGAAEAMAAAEMFAVEIKTRLEAMAAQLAEERAKGKAGAAALEALEEQRRRDAAAKRQKTLTAFFAKPLEHQARPRAEPVQLGVGYTERNISSGCFAQHVKALETHIVQLCLDDPLKQLQLGAAINQRLQGIRDLRDRDYEAWGYIRNSLKAFFETLQDKYLGRFPNHVRAAQQAVCAAIANAAPPRKLHVISEELGVSVERLSEGRKHWSDWVAGGRESLMDLRGKIRSDSMDEAWIEFAIGIWKDNTRRSERAKDSLRNPRDRSDKTLYRVHWLEVRIGAHRHRRHCCLRCALPLTLPRLLICGLTVATSSHYVCAYV